jgi:hypothetical protein
MRPLFLLALLSLGCHDDWPRPSVKPLPTAHGLPHGSSDAQPRWSDARPEEALELEVRDGELLLRHGDGGQRVDLGSESFLQAVERADAVVISIDEDTNVAQLAEALAAVLDDARETIWLSAARGGGAFEVRLRDEVAFSAWIDEPKPGKIRVIQRADGLELQTNLGKMPGVDPNGPTVPAPGGRIDLALLRSGLVKLKDRFPNAPDSCLVPSYATPLRHVLAALTGYYYAEGKRTFEYICLVYPRRSKVADSADGGGLTGPPVPSR